MAEGKAEMNSVADIMRILEAKRLGEQRSASDKMLSGSGFQSRRQQPSAGPGGELDPGYWNFATNRLNQAGPQANLASLLNNVMAVGGRLSTTDQATGADSRYAVALQDIFNRQQEMEDLQMAKVRAEIAAARRPQRMGGGMRRQADPNEELFQKLAAMNAQESFAMNRNQRRMSDLNYGDASRMSQVRRGILDDGVIQQVLRRLMNG